MSQSEPGPERAVERADGGAADRIADHLREAILRDELTPGTRLRQEEIAERTGSSRLPVREALRMLTAEGLVEHEPNKGARVPRLTPHEVDVVYRMRERLEPLALVESLPHLEASAIEDLVAIQERIEANDDIERFLELDRALHLGTYAGCDIESLNVIVTRLWNSTQHYRRAFVSRGGSARMWVVNSEHRLLLDAIQRRDEVDAERYLSGHIRRTRIELGAHAADQP